MFQIFTILHYLFFVFNKIQDKKLLNDQILSNLVLNTNINLLILKKCLSFCLEPEILHPRFSIKLFMHTIVAAVAGRL